MARNSCRPPSRPSKQQEFDFEADFACATFARPTVEPKRTPLDVHESEPTHDEVADGYLSGAEYGLTAVPMTLPDEPDETLPRVASALDRLRRHGPRSLTTSDLLTVALGPRAETAVHVLLRRHGAAGLAKLDLDDIARVGRLGKRSASRLAALMEFHRRVSDLENPGRPKLTKPKDVYAHVRGIASAKKEHLVGLYLDAQNGLLHSETITIGSLNTTRSHPREILYPAIQCLALGFILAHNHPSGSLEPSPEDREFTRSIQRAGELMGIELYDHLIVTRTGFTSLRETGMM
jgi:DNA repair protein RadC